MRRTLWSENIGHVKDQHRSVEIVPAFSNHLGRSNIEVVRRLIQQGESWLLIGPVTPVGGGSARHPKATQRAEWPVGT